MALNHFVMCRPPPLIVGFNPGGDLCAEYLNQVSIHRLPVSGGVLFVEVLVNPFGRRVSDCVKVLRPFPICGGLGRCLLYTSRCV